MELEIKKLGKDLLQDYLHFFDEIAFTDNPDWAVCYCFCFHFPGEMNEWGKRSGEENWADAIQYIQSGKMNGYLAYLDNVPVGWCNVNEKKAYPMLFQTGEIKFDDDADVHSIVCFVIDHRERRKGIARKLLQTICEQGKESGVKILEAYPRKLAKTDAENYHGHLQLYLDAGFEVFEEAKNYWIIRKNL